MTPSDAPATSPAITALLAAGLTASLSAIGCGSDEAATSGADEEVALDTPKLTITKNDKGQNVKRYDTDSDGTANVVEYVEEYQDPTDSDVTRKRLVKKLVDVNGDGQFDIVKEYDDNGVLTKETVDDDLDGTKDRVSYYSTETNSLTRKEILGANGETVVTKRFYTGDKIDRTEKDTDGDGTFDLFEYYSGGEIERVGRDTNGDGEIDNWAHASRKETANASGRGDAPSVPNPTESGGGEGQSEADAESGESGGGESGDDESSGDEGSN